MSSVANVPEIHTASNIRAEESIRHEGGGSSYLWNIGNTAHIETMQQPKSSVNISSEPTREPKVSTDRN
jgi:hypothetical protein